MELNEENLKKAYCKTIASTGIGAAEGDCTNLFPQIIKHVVPEALHETYPNKLKACAINTCTPEPYLWTVDDVTPNIDDDTTFQSLYETWFVTVVFE